MREANDRIRRLRQLLRRNGVRGIYLGMTDPHQSEAIAEHWRTIRWLTGFTGTAGCCVITQDKAAFWSDGRYSVQMHRELDGTGMELYNTSEAGTIDFLGWILSEFSAGDVLAMDGEVLSAADFRTFEKLLGGAGIRLCCDKGYVGELWTDRPDVPDAPIWPLPLTSTGESGADKLARVRGAMKAAGVTCYVDSMLEDVAWVTNLQGNDHPIYPIFHGYVMITPEKAWLFVDRGKLSGEAQKSLEKDGFLVGERSDLVPCLRQLPEGSALYLDPYKTPIQILSALPAKMSVREGPNLIASLKCRKNAVEQENIRVSNVKECVAICRFIRHVEEAMRGAGTSEWQLVQDLETFRRMDPDYLEPANLAIIAYSENAALPHYRPTAERYSVLKKEGMLLFDVCAHYRTGTTDLTRVIPVGPCTEEMRRDYTLTLKAHMALARQHFVYGITGDILDGVSKSVLWNESLHFGHGTGHGIGFLMYVHEGPAKIITEYAPAFPTQSRRLSTRGCCSRMNRGSTRRGATGSGWKTPCSCRNTRRMSLAAS